MDRPAGMSDAELEALLGEIAQARSLDEVKTIVAKAAATAATDNIILYAGLGKQEAAILREAVREGVSLINDTDRAAVLSDPRFLAKIGELAGLPVDADTAELVQAALRLPDDHPLKSAAVRANEMVFGREGDPESLKSSFWGEASKEFVDSARGEIQVLLGPEVKQRVFCGVELPAILDNPGERTVNGVPAAELPNNIEAALGQVVPTAQNLATQFAAKADLPAISTPKVPAMPEIATPEMLAPPMPGMGRPAARIGDMHVCPQVTVLVPHVGGPIAQGLPTVLIGKMPAARVGDMAVCVGPPDVIAMGSFTVLIGKQPAARLGDMTAHGGVIVVGLPTVLIGG